MEAPESESESLEDNVEDSRFIFESNINVVSHFQRDTYHWVSEDIRQVHS